MRNLVICCDGTWNTADQKKDGLPNPTNVVKLFNACVDDTSQLKYYHPGVGTEGSFIKRALGGGLGTGLDKNIQSAYHWLCRNYQPGDKIYLFGFSRGAYTVRSLSGFVLRCGLLDVRDIATDIAWSRVEKAFSEGYRGRKEKPKWGKGSKDWQLLHDAEGASPDIHFIGVWDTVGARGVPDEMVLLDLFVDDPKRYSFHDTHLSDRVLHAYHAVALDEIRASFAPTLWTIAGARPSGTSFEQRWFPGDHSDVGGGHLECGLSDIALEWICKMAATNGLKFENEILEQIKPNPQAILHDALDGLWEKMRTLPRAVPELSKSSAETLHPSALERQKYPPISQAPYRPTHRVTHSDRWSGSVYARDRWNATGVWLEKGVRYSFVAEGEWIDLYNRSGPDGMDDGKFQLGELVYRFPDLIALGEKAYQKVTGKAAADFLLTRRHENIPWFALVGMIGNQRDADGGGTPPMGEVFVIGKACEYTPARSGYLYCYANDAWDLYDNNRGQVVLHIAC